MSNYARFMFRAERREHVWRLSGFDSIHHHDEITPLIPGQTAEVDPEAVKPFRPSCRLLYYCLASGGFSVRDNVAEVDRPDLVDALSRESMSGPDSRRPGE